MRLTVQVLVPWVLLLAAPPQARAEWRLDPAVAQLAPPAREALEQAVRDAPRRALEAILRQETEHLERVRSEELAELQRETWRRLFAEQRDGGPLWRALERALADLGLRSQGLLARVWQDERARLQALPLRLWSELLDQAFRRALVSRLAAVRDARLTYRTDLTPAALAGGERTFGWRLASGDGALRSALALPTVTFEHSQAELQRALLDARWESPLGRARVKAAAVEGLARARSGTVVATTGGGQRIEGLGVEFGVRAKVTGLDLQGQGELALGEQDLGLRLQLACRARVEAEASGSAEAVVSERGAAARADLGAGGSAAAELRLPVTLELLLLRARVEPRASISAGVGASARAEVELTWTGRLRCDVQATASLGLGGGAGLCIEVELGAPVKLALSRLLGDPRGLLAELEDRARGRTWRGPRLPSGALRCTPEDLASLARARGLPPRPERPEQVAARFAPVIYQELRRGPADYLRAVDFDGGWDVRDDWEHLDGGDARAVVYWSLASTETHWLVTYAWFHPRRERGTPFSGRPNDFHGCLVAARRGAPPGEEVDGVVLSNGDSLAPLSGALRAPARFATLVGEARFVDEAAHPWLDVERTHPQVWVTGGEHRVVGFNGNDDVDPFSGGTGVVYVPTGQAEAPEHDRDHAVGYALRPLADLLAHADEGAWLDAASRRALAGTNLHLPTRLLGGRGDERGVPPWAWFATRETFHSSARDPAAYDLHAGHTWSDPARTVRLLLETRGTAFGETYPAGGDASGLVGGLGP